MKSPRLIASRWLTAALLLATASAQPVPPAAEWPEFRGPTGQGSSTATGLPVEWSTAKNVSWRQVVPGTGWSSPVVANDQIFLTAGVSGGRGGPALHALCIEASSGHLLWNTEVFRASESRTQPIHGKNTEASPTPLLEGNRLYVHFGHHGTACLDRDGRIVWRNNRLDYESVHGNGGSPILVGDRLVFHADGAQAPFVAALDKHTGDVLWQMARPAVSNQTFSFSTPLSITVNGRPQIVSPASGAVFALDPADGRELWRVRYRQGYSVVPRPVFGHGLVYVATGFNRADLLAIRPDGEGDVTDTHIAWRTTKGAPLTPSVVLAGGELYGVNDAGVATCWDAKTGEVHWQEKIDGNYSASPLAADGRIYFQNETGTGTVLKAGRVFAKLATNAMGERTLASYAVTGTALLIRTERHLYRIEERGRAGL